MLYRNAAPLAASLLLLMATSSQAAEAPATAPAPDTSTPRATLKAFHDLVVAGDFDAARSLFITPVTDTEKVLLAEAFSEAMYSAATCAALRQKFPTATFPEDDKMILILKANVDKMHEAIDGDSATISREAPAASAPANNNPLIRFKKIDGKWKIVLEANPLMRLPTDEQHQANNARRAVQWQLLTDLKAGKYANFEDFRKDQIKKLDALK